MDVSKLKSLADDKSKVRKIMKLALHQTENILEKGENAGYQHFSFSPNVFKSFLSDRVVKSRIV